MANLSIRLLDKQKSFMQQLLQIVIHDLSNPISVMQSHIDILARKYNIPKEELVALSASTKILERSYKLCSFNVTGKFEKYGNGKRNC